MNEVERGQRRRGKERTTKKTGMGGCTGDGTDGYGYIGIFRDWRLTE